MKELQLCFLGVREQRKDLQWGVRGPGLHGSMYGLLSCLHQDYEGLQRRTGYLAVSAAGSHQWEERELWCPSELKSEAISHELSWRYLEDP